MTQPDTAQMVASQAGCDATVHAENAALRHEVEELRQRVASLEDKLGSSRTRANGVHDLLLKHLDA